MAQSEAITSALSAKTAVWAKACTVEEDVMILVLVMSDFGRVMGTAVEGCLRDQLNFHCESCEPQYHEEDSELS